MAVRPGPDSWDDRLQPRNDDEPGGALGIALRSAGSWNLSAIEVDGNEPVPGSPERVAWRVARAMYLGPMPFTRLPDETDAALRTRIARRPRWDGAQLDLLALPRHAPGVIATLSRVADSGASRLVPRGELGLEQFEAARRVLHEMYEPHRVMVGNGPIWETDAGERLPLHAAPREWLEDLYAWLERGVMDPPPGLWDSLGAPWQTAWQTAVERELARRGKAEPDYVLPIRASVRR